MDDLKKKTKRTITMVERFKVMSYIEEHCIKGYGPDKKYAQWDDAGKKDTNVADLFKPSIPTINPDHVMRMRQEMGLLLEPSRWKFATAVGEEIEARLEVIDAALRILEARMTALEDRYTNPKLIR